MDKFIYSNDKILESINQTSCKKLQKLVKIIDDLGGLILDFKDSERNNCTTIFPVKLVDYGHNTIKILTKDCYEIYNIIIFDNLGTIESSTETLSFFIEEKNIQDLLYNKLEDIKSESIFANLLIARGITFLTQAQYYYIFAILTQEKYEKHHIYDIQYKDNYIICTLLELKNEWLEGNIAKIELKFELKGEGICLVEQKS